MHIQSVPLAGGLLALCCLLSRADAQQEIDFNRDIRPLLSDNCYACHGPDAVMREAGLRLDTPAGVLEDLGGYQAVVPGKPDQSELVRRVLSDDPDEVMPPHDHRKQLSDDERKRLVRWVEQGAPWADHWSYIAPQRHTPPTLAPPVDEASRAGNWIDAFVLQQVYAQGLQPAARADKRTLLRRLSFDLTGLPPSPEEVLAFMQDDTPTAYQKVVERLLASPYFGERLGTYWLDLVRYADTVGYHGDQNMEVSPFRDYVIDAFNENRPFDQFTREQLAGDLLPDPSVEQLVASGYNKLGMMSAEGGVQPKEYLAKYAADRVRTASTVWLGSTLGCAECHDHKFDPFSTKDFYQFEAFFADIQERGLYSGANVDGKWGPTVEVTSPVLPTLLSDLDQQIAQAQQRLMDDSPEREVAQANWERETLATQIRWQVLEPESVSSEHATKLAVQEDGSVLASGTLPATDNYTCTLPSGAIDQVRGIRLELLPDASLPQSGPGRAGNGNLVLTELQLWLVDGDKETEVPLRNASATIEQKDASNDNPYGAFSAAAAIDKDVHSARWGWAILPEAGKPQTLVAETAEPLQVGDSTLKIVLQQQHGTKHTIGRFRLSATSAAGPLAAAADPLSDELWAVLQTEPSQRTVEQSRRLREHYVSISPQLEPLRQRLAELRKQREQIVAEHTRTTLITKTVPPREIRVLPRGNWMDQSGEVVQPATPHFLPGIQTERRANRLDLANWIVARDNPLTARVFVNRLWKRYFGTGLSKVLDDVGAQGERPTHPELLDTLAVEFMDSGWDVKHMIRLLVLSTTYQQSSVPTEEMQTRDPFNRLFARQARFRLDAEPIRDNALAVSGLLVRSIGGRSAKPYQPEGLYQHLNFPRRTYQADTGQQQYRRGVYTHWQRQFLHPAMKTFDAPAREECTAERPRSNTPLGALVLLNDPSYVEAARVFATRALRSQATTTDERIDWMLLNALSRAPQDRERAILRTVVDTQAESFRENPAAAQALIATGLSEAPQDLDPIELASWTFVARTIFNTHEFIVRN